MVDNMESSDAEFEKKFDKLLDIYRYGCLNGGLSISICDNKVPGQTDIEIIGHNDADGDIKRITINACQEEVELVLQELFDWISG